MEIVYIGCFVSKEELLQKIPFQNRLHKVIEKPHVTFAYRPKEIPFELFGTKVKIRCFAYGNDGKNEGVRVELTSDNVQLNERYQKIKTPHITLSVAKGQEPVYTENLNFTPMEEFTLEGVFGAFLDGGKVIFS